MPLTLPAEELDFLLLDSLGSDSPLTSCASEATSCDEINEELQSDITDDLDVLFDFSEDNFDEILYPNFSFNDL